MAGDEHLAEVVAAEPDQVDCSRWIVPGLPLCASASLFCIAFFLMDDEKHGGFISAILDILGAAVIILAAAFFYLFLALLFRAVWLGHHLYILIQYVDVH
jgi:hypothetical protein